MEYEMEERPLQLGEDWLAPEPLDFFDRAYRQVAQSPRGAPDCAVLIPEQDPRS